MIRNNWGKYIQWILGTIAAFSLIVLIFFLSVTIPVFNKRFFFYEYKKNNVMETIVINEEDISKVTESIMEYLSDNKNTLDVLVTINGQERDFFNEREKQHMVDVKQLFLTGYKIRNVSLLILPLSILLLFLMKTDIRKVFSKCFTITALFTLILFVFAGVLVATGFSKYFELFHKIFFDNDLWILDPGTDMLINLVPEQFFVDISVFIAVIFMALMLFTMFILRERK